MPPPSWKPYQNKMKFKKFLTGSLLAIMLVYVFAPVVSLAQTPTDDTGFFGANFCPCCTNGGINPATGAREATEPCHLADIVTLLDHIVKIALYLSFFIGVIMLVYGGFKMITAAGNTSDVEKGKDAIKYAIIGMLVAFGAWLIVNTILVELTNKGGVDLFINPLRGGPAK